MLTSRTCGMHIHRRILSSRTSSPVVGSLLAGVLWCCSSGSAPSGRSFVAVVASGRVSDSLGLAVSGARVSLVPVALGQGGIDRVGDCVGRIEGTPVVTNTVSGRFLVRIARGPAIGQACVAATVSPPSRSGLAPSIVSSRTVQFRVVDPNVVLDTATFTIVLSRAP